MDEKNFYAGVDMPEAAGGHELGMRSNPASVEEIALREMEKTETILQFFEAPPQGHDDTFSKLLRQTRGLAIQIGLSLRRGPERTTALRKLLEARDCMIRAVTARRSG